MTNETNSNDTLSRLAEIITQRADSADGNTSYTAKLLAAGTEKCSRKFGEEAIELILASAGQDKQHVISEAADVVYHLLVLLQSNEVTLEEVLAELEQRFAQSGLEEKASRNKEAS